MSPAAVSPAELRSIDLFDELDDGDLAAWTAVAAVHETPAGDVLAEQGVPPPGVHLLLSGTARMYVSQDGRLEPVGRQEAPTWMGAIAVLTEGTSGVRMVAETDCRVALVPPDDFRRLALAQPAVHRRVMRQVAPVMSRVSEMEQSRERLAALGTMAAGLAHELNNPAAAAERAAAQMSEVLGVLGSTVGHFVESGVEREQAHRLVELQREALRRAEGRTALDVLDAADAEDALRERLDDLGVPEAWNLAEPLAAAGVDEAWVDAVAGAAGAATGAAMEWIAASITACGLAEELHESARRISALVGAVKTYAYMDRGGLVEVDLHEGLETTLVVMGHKLRPAGVTLVRDYDRSLPPLTVHGSELNQVWTNLIDNAIDAVGHGGTITIRTLRDGDCAVVEVEDDGPGVPQELRERVFDSFFTTKEVGAGTGLGLATARRIVADRHDGSLSLESRPGRTVLRARLPLPT